MANCLDEEFSIILKASKTALAGKMEELLGTLLSSVRLREVAAAAFLSLSLEPSV